MSTTTPVVTTEAPAGADPGELRVRLVTPMIGIENSMNFVIRPLGRDYGAFALMASVEESGLSFVVVPPGALFPDYRFEIPESDVEALGLSDASDVETWVLITRKGVPVPTANLLGPIVVNAKTRCAAQLVLQDSDYSASVPVNAGAARPK